MARSRRNPAGQYNGLVGGNPNLNPEIADTYTLGIVFQPRFIPRLAITIDYFDITVNDPIQPLGQDAILAELRRTPAIRSSAASSTAPRTARCGRPARAT